MRRNASTSRTLRYGPSTAATPWLVPQEHYTGKCVRQNGANVLLLSPIDGARTLNASPTPGWGLHLVDANIALVHANARLAAAIAQALAAG